MNEISMISKHLHHFLHFQTLPVHLKQKSNNTV